MSAHPHDPHQLHPNPGHRSTRTPRSETVRADDRHRAQVETDRAERRRDAARDRAYLGPLL